jgi:hypothetical protein
VLLDPNDFFSKKTREFFEISKTSKQLSRNIALMNRVSAFLKFS